MSKEAMKLVVDKIKSTFWEGYLPEPVKPAQQEPVQNNPLDCGVYLGSGKDYAIKHRISHKPAQQESVGYVAENGVVDWNVCAPPVLTDLYTSPPAQRTWVGLTDEEANKIYKDGSTFGEMMRMVEAKLKEKNNG